MRRTGSGPGRLSVPGSGSADLQSGSSPPPVVVGHLDPAGGGRGDHPHRREADLHPGRGLGAGHDQRRLGRRQPARALDAALVFASFVVESAAFPFRPHLEAGPLGRAGRARDLDRPEDIAHSAPGKSDPGFRVGGLRHRGGARRQSEANAPRIAQRIRLPLRRRPARGSRLPVSPGPWRSALTIGPRRTGKGRDDPGLACQLRACR